MKSILLILILLSFNFIFGQTGLTSYSADIPMRDSLEVDLADIQKSEYEFYFRLLLSGQTIDIFSEDNKVFHGEITNSIKEYQSMKIDDDYRTQATKLYTEKIEISVPLATSIANRIIESGQLSIPTDTLIKSWTRWYLHCGSLKFEIKTESNYIKQSFHCPWNQPDSVEYKDIILTNYNLLKQELNLDSIYQDFWSKLPKGKTYSRSGYGMTYIMTEKQEEAWKKDKPRRYYLKSIKDTIDNYINFKLDSLQATSDLMKFSCFDSYHLTFSKNGKLKKIWTSPEDNMKIGDGLSFYIEDKLEIWKCRKKIKKIFKLINLKSFHLRYELYRTFYFDIGTITDDTIY